MGDLGVGFQGKTTISNLGSFLRNATPVIEAYTITKGSCSAGRTPDDGDKCFYLGDLWNRFYEWSACGVGTPVRLHSGETIVQYFVPYLSGIQLYIDAHFTPQRSPALSRPDCYLAYDRKWLNGHCGYNQYSHSVADDWIDQNGHQMTPPSLKNGDEKLVFPKINEELCFQYFELDNPYDRIPIADKVYELSCKFPGLASLNSIELSPSSWLAVFWYPVGHVPARNLKDLTTCFLTYHNLSTAEDYVPLDDDDVAHGCVALTPFGLASHKMDTTIWISQDSDDDQLADSLFDKAQSWLKARNIKHHDFIYFLNNKGRN